MKSFALETLARAGLKNTPFRRELLRVLEAAEVPLSAAQLFTRLRRQQKLKDVAFDRATLFRNLKTLVARGVLNATEFGTGAAFYCLRSHHHHHVFCVACERVKSLGTCAISPLVEQAQRLGFEVINHRMELLGLCPDCR